MSILKPSKYLPDSLQDFVEEMKYRLEGKAMPYKQLLKLIFELYAKTLREKACHIYLKGSFQYG